MAGAAVVAYAAVLLSLLLAGCTGTTAPDDDCPDVLVMDSTGIAGVEDGGATMDTAWVLRCVRRSAAAPLSPLRGGGRDHRINPGGRDGGRHGLL